MEVWKKLILPNMNPVNGIYRPKTPVLFEIAGAATHQSQNDIESSSSESASLESEPPAKRRKPDTEGSISMDSMDDQIARKYIGKVASFVVTMIGDNKEQSTSQIGFIIQ